jgi:hypothetical protein
MEHQRRFVREILQHHLPDASLRGGFDDLAALQSILDAGLVRRDQPWELQALGVVFGDAMASIIPGLAWWSVTDEFGTDPTLRYRESSLNVNALFMIAKRVERGEAANVKALVDLTAEHISKSAGKYK